MAVIIESIEPRRELMKKVTCRNCLVDLRYTPADVTERTYRDISQTVDTVREIHCPNCQTVIKV